MKKWTTEEIDLVVLLHSEGLSRAEIVAELKDNGIVRSSNSIKHCIETYSDADLDEESKIEMLKAKNSAQKSRAKVAKENKVLMEGLESQETILERFQELIEANPPVIYEPFDVEDKAPTKRTIVAHLSDTHFQSGIDGEEMGGINKYGNTEESRRLAFFTREIANYKRQHRHETDLVIALNGDIIQGVIHDQESTAAATTQVSAALHLLTQSISFLASEYKNIRVICTVGNHARMMHKGNKGRQTREKWDSFATIINVGLKYALKGHKNVSFEIPVAPYAYTDILGHKFLFTHSDTVLNVGYPGKSINVVTAKNKINDLKEGIGHIDVVCAGHVHVDTKQILPNGVVLLTNGSMSGVDEFALSIGITSNNPTQQIFEVTEAHSVGDLRSVQVLEADDMEELDDLIEPFSGKF
jgi:hypothetical protein